MIWLAERTRHEPHRLRRTEPWIKVVSCRLKPRSPAGCLILNVSPSLVRGILDWEREKRSFRGFTRDSPSRDEPLTIPIRKSVPNGNR
jgi:hypothetical protein